MPYWPTSPWAGPYAVPQKWRWTTLRLMFFSPGGIALRCGMESDLLCGGKSFPARKSWKTVPHFGNNLMDPVPFAV